MPVSTTPIPVASTVNDAGSLTTIINSLISRSAALVTEVNQNETDIGTMSSLQTINKTSLVSAINELIEKFNSGELVAAYIGQLNSLNTSTKVNIVAAVNEVNAKIGNVTDLQTENTSNVVAAVNEIFEVVQGLDSLDAGSIIAELANKVSRDGDAMYGPLRIQSGAQGVQTPVLGLGWSDGLQPTWQFMMESSENLALWLYNKDNGLPLGKRFHITTAGNVLINGELFVGNGSANLNTDGSLVGPSWNSLGGSTDAMTSILNKINQYLPLTSGTLTDKLTIESGASGVAAGFLDMKRSDKSNAGWKTTLTAAGSLNFKAYNEDTGAVISASGLNLATSGAATLYGTLAVEGNSISVGGTATLTNTGQVTGSVWNTLGGSTSATVAIQNYITTLLSSYVGFPTGGLAGQALVKASGTDYDFTWAGPYAAASHGHTIANITSLQATLDGKLSSANPAVTGSMTVTGGTAVTAADYITVKPSDTGAGKPAVVLRKPSTTAANWELRLWDGTNTNGNFNIDVGTFTYKTNTIWHAGNGGAGSALDAGLLEGNNAAFYRNAANMNSGVLPSARLAGTYTNFTGITSSGGISVANAQPWYDMSETDTTTNARITLSGGVLYIQSAVAGAGQATGSGSIRFSGWGSADINEFTVRHSGAWRTIWHSGNGGSGSGLDAGLLEGNNAAFYRSASNLNAGTLPNARISGAYDGITTLTTNVIRILSASDASTTSTAHGLQIGPSTGANLIIDTNEIISLNNGVYADINLVGTNATVNAGTGVVNLISSHATGVNVTNGKMRLTSTAPELKFIDTTSGQYSARMRVDANNVYMDGSTDDVTFTEVFRFELDTKFAFFGNARLSATGAATATSTAHAFQIGSTTSGNLAMDTKRIVSRSNGVLAPLYLDGSTVIVPELKVGTNGINFANNDYLQFDDSSNFFIFYADDLTDKAGISAAKIAASNQLGSYNWSYDADAGGFGMYATVLGEGRLFLNDTGSALNLKRVDSNGAVATFRRTGTTSVGTISITTSATAYNTSSDERLKTDFKSIDPDVIDQVNVYDFEFIRDPGLRAYGVKAQELYEVLPQAVTVGGENVDEEPWSVDYSKLVPHLVAAVKELRERVAYLENK